MPEEKEPLDDVQQYHNDCVIMNLMMAHPGWQTLLSRWAKKRQSLETKILKQEVDVQVGGTTKSEDGKITIVVLNKDEDKIKLAFIKTLENEFRNYQAEAVKPLEAQDE